MTGKSFRAFVDRIEGDKAVLLVGDEEQCKVILPVDCLPDGAREGAVLTVNLEYDPELTAEAFEKSQSLVRRLSNENK